ncbi:MAG: hypothetical protein AB8I08_29230 [Sandaracinaceae bacterium]
MSSTTAQKPLGVVSAMGLLVLTALVGGLSVPGCAEFDTTPLPVTHGTLGEEVVEVFCERIAAAAERGRPEGEPRDVTGTRWRPVCEGRGAPPTDAPPRLVALHANRTRLVAALDQTLPASLEDDLGVFLEELLPFFDPPEERLPTQTRRLADFLAQLSADDEALAALERIGTREGYRPLRLSLGVARPALAYPDFDQFTDLALATLLDGAAESEFRDLQRAAALEMATAEPAAPEVGPSTLRLTRDLMFSEDDGFATGTPAWILLRDVRGLALTEADASGRVLAPFVDADTDNLPDLDAQGRFVTAGEALPTPFPIRGEAPVARDGSGRALRSDGSRYYRYLDADRTMLSGLTAEMAPWFDPAAPTLMQMSRGLPLLLGPEMEASQTYGAATLRYPAFDDGQGSLYEVLHALGETLHRPETLDALRVAEALIRDHESEVAGVLRAGRELANRGDMHPDAQLRPESIFWDDLIALIVRIAQRPGMLEAIMRSFSDPASASIGDVYGSFMRHRDRVSYDPSNPAGPPVGFPLDVVVDRSAPDTFDNESLFQRTAALIDALDGVTVCNKEGARLNISVSLGPITLPLRWPLFGTAGECELIRIDNVAEAYARTILGTYELELQSGLLTAITNLADGLGIDVDQALEQSSGIPGLTRMPTPQALNRLVFWGLSDDSGVRSCIPNEDGGNCNSAFAGQLFDPVVDRHGNDVIARFHGTIFAWEQPGFYEGMRPLLEVLHRPEYTNEPVTNDYFFGEILRVVHEHWASPDNTQQCSAADGCAPGDANFTYASNGRSYEALLAEGFIEAQLLARVQPLNVALESIEVRPGVDGVATLAGGTEVLVDPARSPALTDRRGTSMTPVNDGSREVPVTPLYLMLDALNAMDRDLAVDDDRRRDWRTARGALVAQFLGTETLGTEFRLENRRARAMLLAVLPFVQERIEFHRDQGDLLEWATGLDNRMADTMRGPLAAGAVRFLDSINRDPEARDALSRLLGYLVDEASGNDAFLSMLNGGADALMVFEDDRNIVPLLRALSESMAPNVREVVASGGDPNLDGSAVRDSLDLIRDISAVDDARTLRVILQNIVSIPAAGDEITPLETIVDVIAEVNRAAPDEGGPLRADDYRAVLGQTTDFLLDEDHGLERLNALVQQRACFPEEGLACDAAGESRASRGTCYPEALCTCGERDGGLAWACTAP